MLPEIYEGKPIPKLVGPDSHGITDDLTRAFVAAANAAELRMHAITFHEYSLNPTEHPSLSDLKSIGAKEQELWVGEAGGTAGGGHPGVTDSYASGLWWLAQAAWCSSSRQSRSLCTRPIWVTNCVEINQCVATPRRRADVASMASTNAP